MELKVKNGMVDFILISGKDRVKGAMTEGEARSLVSSGNVKEVGKAMIVNDKFIFGEEPKEEVKAEVKEEPKAEVKEEDKPLKEVKGKPLTEKKPRRKKAKK